MKRWAWAITAGCGWPCPGSATARVCFDPASRPPAPLNGCELQRRRRLQPRHQPVIEQQRSEEHTSELQSLMRISYAVFCLKKKKKYKQQREDTRQLLKTHLLHHQYIY